MEQKRFVILRSTMKLIKNSFLFGIITYVGVTLVFRLNIFNLLQTYGYWKMRYSEFVGFSFNPLKILGNLYTMFLDVLSPLEVILIPFVLYYIYIQFNKWRKEKKLTTSAKFLLYFLAIYFIAASQVLVGNPEVFRAIIFYLPFFMVFAYTIEHFTEKLKQKDLIRVLIVILFIIVYAGINIANPVPYSSTYQNSFALPFYSILSEEDANTHTHLHKAMLTGVIEWDQIKKDVDKLPLGINESIIGPRQIIQAADERYEYYILKEQIKAQYGREPTLQEQIAMNINPSGKKYKYFIGSSPEQVEGLNVTLLKEYSYQGTTYFYLYEIGEHKIQ